MKASARNHWKGQSLPERFKSLVRDIIIFFEIAKGRKAENDELGRPNITLDCKKGIFPAPTPLVHFWKMSIWIVFMHIMYISVFKSPNPKIFQAFAYHSVLPPSSADWIPSVAHALSHSSLVLLPSLALVTTGPLCDFFSALPSIHDLKLNSPRGPVNRGDQSQRRQEDWRAALRGQDPWRCAKRREPAKLLCPPKKPWDSTFNLKVLKTIFN